MYRLFFYIALGLVCASGSVLAQQNENSSSAKEKTVIGPPNARPVWSGIALRWCLYVPSTAPCMYNKDKFIDSIGVSADGKAMTGFGLSRTGKNVQVGYFKDNFMDGLGIEYSLTGETLRMGRWAGGALVERLPLEARDYPFDLELKKTDSLMVFHSKKFSDSLGVQSLSLNEGRWIERVSTKASIGVADWVSRSLGDMPQEIAPPKFPAPLNLKQEKWESDSEFEVRVGEARTARQIEIDRLQNDYKSKVDARNTKIVAAQKKRLELERDLPAKKLELIESILKSTIIPLKITSSEFDSKRSILFLNISVDGADAETFAFKESPIELRRTALT